MSNEINGGIILKKTTKLLSVLLSTLTLIPVCSFTAVPNETKAATLANLNSDCVFLKQHASMTCTLSSNAMMLRRAMMLKGGDWESITEESCRYSFWIEGVGMPYDYSFRGIHVGNERIYGNSAEKLRILLQDHPEGIVAYDYDYPHAVLLTDYTDGKFYCADPANNTPAGRIEVSESLVNIYDIEDYWYVTDTLPEPYDTTINNQSTISSETTVVGKAVSITGCADGGEGKMTYSFFYKEHTTDEWQTLKNTAADKAMFSSDKAGKYYVKAVAADAKGSSAKKVFTVKVNEKLEVSAKTNQSKINYGEDVVMNFSGKNGTGGYQYEVNAVKPSGDTVNLRKYNKSATFKYHPWETGTYKIIVNAKDSMGNVASSDVNFTVKSTALINNSTISTDNINYGEEITVQGIAIGGAGGYQFKISAKKPGGKVVNLRKYSNYPLYVYHPWEAGTYTLIVSVKDAEGKVVSKEFPFTVNLRSLTNLTTASANMIEYGKDITFTGSAVGGAGGYQYKYYAVKPSGQRVNLRKFNSATSFTYHPWERGTYTIEAVAKDSFGNTATKMLTFTVG